MLYAGIYNKGITYRFRYEVADNARSFMILVDSTDTMMQAHAKVLQISGKAGLISKNLILGHIITNKKQEIKSYYGDLDLLDIFMKDLAMSGLMNLEYNYNLQTDATFHESYEVPNGSLELYLIKPESVRTIRQLNGFDYKKFTAIDIKRSNVAVYAKSGNVRNLEYLKSVYDLSWILDEYGKLKRDYRSVRTMEALNEVIEGIESHEIISLDFETTGVEFYHAMKEWDEDKQPKIVGIGISWAPGMARYIPLISNKFECLPYWETIHTIFKLLENKKLIGANLLFDFGVAYYHGYLFECFFDVMQAEFDIDPTGSRNHKKLKEITRFYLGWETLELDEVLGGPVDGRLIPDVDEDVILIYGGADVDTVWSVMESQKPYLLGKELIWKIDMKMIPIIAVEDYYGCKMDMEVWEVLNNINLIDKNNIENTIWEYLEEKALWKTVRNTARLCYNEELSDEDIISIINLQPELRDTARELLMKNKGKNRKRLQLSSSRDLLYLFSEILDYPIYRNMGGKISLDEEYLTKLSNETTSEPEHFLKEDLMSEATRVDVPWLKDLSSEEAIVLSKDELERCKYPFAVMLKRWRKLEKRDNSFFAPIKKDSINGWYNHSTSMSAADTARFINPTQTLQGYLKKLDIPYDNSRYFVQFDLAQIEFRVMIGNAVRSWNNYCKNLPDNEVYNILREKDISHLVDRLNIPWTDYHREGGSVLVGTTPAKMTKAERSRVKSTHFAVPYGAETYTIAKPKLLNAKSDAEREAILQDTEEILMRWKKTMFPLHKYLETKRDIALQELPDSELPPKLKGGKWGRVVNSFGRCRYYDLNYNEIAERRMVKDGHIEWLADKKSSNYLEMLAKTKRQVQGSIRRSAGNYPIQSDAREFFAQIMIKLFNYCKANGLSGTGNYETDKIIQSLMIHDENHLQVSKDIHPFKIYQIIFENCLLSFKDYPTFYMGIAICDSWYESKDDKFEAPVQFVKDIIKSYKENPDKYENEDWKSSPKDYVLGYISRWISKDCDEFIKRNTVDNVFDLKDFRKYNDNYFYLTKPILYTRKFSNAEDDISKPELALLSHNTNMNLIIRTETRDIVFKDYVWQYEEKPKESNDGDLNLTNEFSDINLDFENTIEPNDVSDSLFSEVDFSDIFDSDDIVLKEEDADKCYWLYSEAERSYNSYAELESFEEELDITDELPEKPKRKAYLACIADTWVIDAEQLRGEKAKLFTDYMKKYVVDPNSYKGLPVIIMTKAGAKQTKTRYSRNVDLIGLEMILSD